MFKGMKDGEVIRFGGQGNECPGHQTGDIVIVLDEIVHKLFRHHESDDLLMEMNIDYNEALRGISRTVVTPDARKLLVTSTPGKRPESVMALGVICYVM